MSTNNWVTNTKMKTLLNNISAYPPVEKLEMNTKSLKALFLPPFKQVRDCIIISEKSANELEANFPKAIKIHTDKTGYEAGNTETRINCCFENEISITAGIQIALMAIEIWAIRLKQMEPDSEFCFIMCSDEQHVEIRFHKLREDEIGWLSDDIEGYKDEAVGYLIL